MTEQKNRYYWWFLFPAGILYALLIHNHWNPTNDSAIYISAAKSIVEGRGYYYQGVRTYPPLLFSLLLAPIIALFGCNFTLMRLLMAISALGALFFTCRLLETKIAVPLIIGIGLLTGLNEHLVYEVTRILSDLPYMFFSYAALYWAQVYYSKNRVNDKYGWLCALTVVLAYFTRTIGVSLVIGICAFFLLEGFLADKLTLLFKKSLLILLIFALPAGLWFYRAASTPPEQRYIAEHQREVSAVYDDYKLPLNVKNVWRNCRYYTWIMGRMVIGSHWYLPGQAYLVIFLVLCGLIRVLYNQRGVGEYYFLSYLLTVLSFSGHQGTRYLLPVIPFIFYYFCQGILFIFQQVSKILQKVMEFCPDKQTAALMSLILLLSYSHMRSNIVLVQYERMRPYYRGIVAEFLQAVDWIKHNTAQDSVVISECDPWVHLLGERYSVGFPRQDNPAKTHASIVRNKADYAIYSRVTRLSERYLKPVIEQHPESFQEVYRYNQAVVYKISVKK
ncbi:MAG: hypothetical protein HZA78_02990 [Candidatus Schekmanbacteria bacterium]|nr:hypothetical protein [Candidatus Schekmanbacteria bacterium]